MIILLASMKAKPGQGEALETLLRSLIPRVQQEDGVVNYILHRHLEEKDRFFFYERYATRAVYDAHMKTAYLREVLAKAETLLNEPGTVELFEDLAETAPQGGRTECEAYAANGRTVWGRADMQGKQKEYCICWACRKFKPEAEDKGCPIIRSVLGLAAETGTILPVWACPEFSKKA